MLDYVKDSEKFLKEELPLFEDKIFGIRIWEFLRYAVWKDLQKTRTEGLNLSRSSTKKPFKISILTQVFKGIKSKNQWVISNRVQFSGSDILDPAIGHLDLQGLNFVLEQEFNDDRIINLSELNRVVDFLFSIFSFFPAVLAGILFRVEILDHYVSKKVIFLRLIRCFNWLIFWRVLIWLSSDLRRVIVNTHYSMQAHTLLLLTERFGIVYEEYQHGTLGNSHIAYNCAFEEKIWPTTLFVWGKAWVKNMRYSGKIAYCSKPNYKGYSIGKDIDVLFIGQSREDIRIAYKKFHYENPKLCVVYLPHPQEVSFEPRTVDSYELLARSSVVLGVWSTMLIEALRYNCIVWRMPLPFHDVLDDFNIPILTNLSFDDMLNWQFSKTLQENIWNK